MIGSLLDIKRVFKAVMYSYHGLKDAVVYQPSFRQLLVVCIILVPLAVWIGESGFQIAVMIGSLFVALITELTNSAIETVVDRISLEEHELSKRAKDIGSAAVFFSIVNVIVIWSVILLI